MCSKAKGSTCTSASCLSLTALSLSPKLLWQGFSQGRGFALLVALRLLFSQSCICKTHLQICCIRYPRGGNAWNSHLLSLLFLPSFLCRFQFMLEDYSKWKCESKYTVLGKKYGENSPCHLYCHHLLHCSFHCCNWCLPSALDTLVKFCVCKPVSASFVQNSRL